MPAPIPETIANDLIAKLESYTLDNRPSEFEYMYLHTEADKLKSVRADEGWMITGIIHSLKGEAEACKKAFEKSLKLPSDEKDVVLSNYSKALRILGLFDESLSILENNMNEASPEMLSQASAMAYSQGLLDKAITYGEKYNRLVSKEGLSIMTVFASFCDDLEIDGTELHELTMLVSKVLYDKEKLATSIVPSLDPETGRALYVLFHVEADAQTLSDVEWDIAMQMDNHDFPSIEAGKLMPIIKSVHWRVACKPEDILNIAIELSESSNEAKIRASIGRSYYAVYHSCLLDLEIEDTSKWVGGSGGVHEKLSQEYLYSNRKGISFILNNMKGKRHIADYELNSNELSRTDAEASIKSAQRLLEQHGHLSSKD